ncbi:MAG: hypothetical protein ACK41F_04880 [Fimbriimonadaceae bacterium]
MQQHTGNSPRTLSQKLVLAALLACLLLAAGYALVVLGGSVPMEESGGAVGTTVVGIDVSGSALARKEDLMRLARREIQNVQEGTLEIHRFDRKAQELYSGEPLLDPERLTKHLRSWFEEAAGGLGTSLPAFLQRVDQRLATLEKPVRIVVVSDCGMELTTPQERSAALALTRRWSEQGQVAEIAVYGLSAGQREAIRASIDPRLLRIRDDL